MAKPLEGIISVLREPLRPGGRDTQAQTLGSLRRPHSEVEGHCLGHCKGPLGKVQGSSAADPGNPSKCSQSQSPIPACSLSLLCTLQCHRNVVAEASCLSLRFLNLSLIPHCEDRSLNSPIAQPQVCLGGKFSVWLPKSFGPLCTVVCISLSSLACTHSHTALANLYGYTHTHTHTHTHTISHTHDISSG